MPVSERLERSELRHNDIVLTFDDGLRCQYDIALPILNKHGIGAFWFVYSSLALANRLTWKFPSV